MTNHESVSARAKRIKTERKRTAARRYAEAGLLIVPLHGKTQHGRCTCGAADCNRPGAHPRTPIADATKDVKTVARMWANWPKAKIGIALGGPAKLVALVTDSAAARETLKEMATRHGALPLTVTIQYGEQWIRLFRCPRRQIPNVNIAEGVRLLGDGEFIVAPSRVGSQSGDRHFATCRALDEVKLAEAPAWLFAMHAGLGTDRVDTSQTPAAPPAAPPRLAIVKASDVVPARINWIWPNIIATGRVTSLVGRPGDGKSQVAIDIAATVSTGRPWPGNVANGTAAKVIILSADDDLADIIVPRLTAASANLDAAHLVKAVKNAEGAERPFNLTVDLERLERELDLGGVRLVIVDPASEYLTVQTGRPVNRNQGNEVRSVLDRCASFAVRHNLALLVVAQLNKSAGAHAIARAAGSVEWTAVPHAAHLIMREANSNRRLFLSLKNKLAADRNGYAFEIREKVLAGGIRTSALVWYDDPVTISPDEALAASAGGMSSGAMKFLREALRNGPQAQREIEDRGRAAGFSPKQLRTAFKRLGGDPKKEGFGSTGRWVWTIPAMAACPGPVVNADTHKSGPSGKSPAPAGSAADNPTGGADKPPENADPSVTAGRSDGATAATEGGR